MVGESNRGEKRTGPALNPLKGSSARLPHCLYYCIPEAKTNSFVFIFLSLDGRVKMLYPRENLPGRFPPAPGTLGGAVLVLRTVPMARIIFAPGSSLATGKPKAQPSSRPILDPAEFSLLL